MSVTIIIPSLDPDEKLLTVVNNLTNAGYKDIIIVNDGTDKSGIWPFEELKTKTECTILNHEYNKGKGRALKTAFEYILENRKDIIGVITVDGDNQHTVKAIMDCEKAMSENPETVILGSRRFNGDNVPLRSKMGNNITSFVFRFCCGIKIKDTQTGLRALPYEHLKFFSEIEGERFEYETNMLLEMKNNDINFKEVLIETVYIEDNKSSHFNTVKDSIRVYAIIIKYLLSSIMSAVIDLIVFSLIGLVFASGLDDSLRLFVATVGARAVSSFFNFMFNRKAVFKSDEPFISTVSKYYSLCICQMIVSYGLVFLFTNILEISGILEVLVKLIVDSCLFVCCFQLQRVWVFKKKKSIN